MWHFYEWETCVCGLAKKYFATPGTSVPPEKAFSSGGSEITKQRASLKPKNEKMQVFLAQNKNFIWILYMCWICVIYVFYP